MKFMKLYRKYLITGLISIIPIIITYWIVQYVFLLVSIPGKKIINPLIHYFGISDKYWILYMDYIFGFILTIFIINLLGLIVSNVIGKKIYNFFEKILNKIPFINTVYSSIKQIISTFSSSNKDNFKKVVLVEYPKKDLWTLAMVTGESKNNKNELFYNIFVPTTPNPTSGYLLFVKKENTVDTKLTIEEALKIIISGGLVSPESLDVE